LRTRSPSTSRCPLTRGLPAFPTRRSSDLVGVPVVERLDGQDVHPVGPQLPLKGFGGGLGKVVVVGVQQRRRLIPQLLFGNPDRRSEEHTSELQSRENLVCRLLPEKKESRD